MLLSKIDFFLKKIKSQILPKIFKKFEIFYILLKIDTKNTLFSRKSPFIEYMWYTFFGSRDLPEVGFFYICALLNRGF